MYSSHPGAMPNDSRSASESYSNPKALAELVMRATLPSTASSPTATRICQRGLRVLAVAGGDHAEKAEQQVGRRKEIGEQVQTFFHVTRGTFR